MANLDDFKPYVAPSKEPISTYDSCTVSERSPSLIRFKFWPIVGWGLLLLLSGVCFALMVGNSIGSGTQDGVIAALVWVFLSSVLFYLGYFYASKERNLSLIQTDSGLLLRLRLRAVGFVVLVWLAAALELAIIIGLIVWWVFG